MRRLSLLCGGLMLAAACVPTSERRAATPRVPAVERLAPQDWPELADDLSLESLERAGKESIKYLRQQEDRYFPFGSRKIGRQLLIDTITELSRVRREAGNGAALNRLLKDRFDLYRINRSSAAESAHFSAYYQPVLPASRKRTERFKYPLFGKPPDMVIADPAKFGKKWKAGELIGRIDDKGRFVPYFNRRDIDVRGKLAGKGLEVAWLESSFDRLNIHIQGSGILRYPDGTEAMAAFAATNGLAYKSVGMAVVGAGVMTRAEITAEKLREYLEEHPEGEAWLINRNPRYTFFDLKPLAPGNEPSGAIGRPLTPGRSIAVDPKVVPLGATAFIRLPMIQADAEGGWLEKHPTRRFVHCQDTGGAIKGPGRVDLFLGHGPAAKATAHNIWEKGSLYILLKKLPPRGR